MTSVSKSPSVIYEMNSIALTLFIVVYDTRRYVLQITGREWQHLRLHVGIT